MLYFTPSPQDIEHCSQFFETPLITFDLPRGSQASMRLPAALELLEDDAHLFGIVLVLKDGLIYLSQPFDLDREERIYLELINDLLLDDPLGLVQMPFAFESFKAFAKSPGVVLVSGPAARCRS